MTKSPEDMTFEDLEAICDAYFCRLLPTPFVSGALPLGNWNHVNFPMTDVQDHDSNPAVHYIEVIGNHSMNISIADLAVQYKNAVMHQDLDLLHRPFGPKASVPSSLSLTPQTAQSLSSSIASSHRNANPPL